MPLLPVRTHECLPHHCELPFKSLLRKDFSTLEQLPLNELLGRDLTQHLIYVHTAERQRKAVGKPALSTPP